MAALTIIDLSDHDVGIVDDQTLEQECDCGTTLELAHLYDYDIESLWYGGICGRCGCPHKVFLDDDVITGDNAPTDEED